MDKALNIIGTQHSYFNQILSELRDQHIQQDRMRFRFNLERAGEILAYELSRHLQYQSRNVITPLGELDMPLLKDQPVLICILRAGLPMHSGFLRIFDRSDNAYISAFRHITKGNDFVIKVEYMACPEIEGRTIILIDPMIATG